ncbi:MAG: hypothetical protein CVV56_06995 [Tenericutes bacterium HGW-Tenericutes-1]|jgi:predicted Zn-dependent protease|nr:MAG: hypothetical protein CVV56_06995 [Tenericutes bacterium HGW-Tenericutes-1]
MIKQLIKTLKESTIITDWMINEVQTLASQAFYVMQKLETTRIVDTTEYQVTVYKRFVEGKVMYTGSSRFQLSHKLSKKELEEKIEEAAYAASFIKNKSYDLVTAERKRSWTQTAFELEPFALLDKIAQIFFTQSQENIRFNSLELFHTTTINHIVSSRNVDYKKTLHKVNVEAIPSYDGFGNKVELYKYYTYNNIDFDVIKNDASSALEDVTTRFQAKAIKDVSKVDVILKDEDLKNLFENLIEDYSYDSIYRQNTDKVIGDSIQNDVTGEYLNIGLKPASKADAFDKDGVLLSQVKVIEKGIISNYYGSNQFAQYLGMKPSGLLRTITVPKGKSSYEQMTKKPYLEIIALSGIQIDMYSNYIGGEVRLAIYFDGRFHLPVSGFSFSGHIDKSLSTLSLSKEMVSIDGYEGPKYIKLKDLEII